MPGLAGDGLGMTGITSIDLHQDASTRERLRRCGDLKKVSPAEAFADTASRCCRHHCCGESTAKAEEQMNNGLQRLEDGTWRVVNPSTKATSLPQFQKMRQAKSWEPLTESGLSHHNKRRKRIVRYPSEPLEDSGIPAGFARSSPQIAEPLAHSTAPAGPHSGHNAS